MGRFDLLRHHIDIQALPFFLLSDPNIAVDGVAPGIFFSKFGNKGEKL